MLCLFIMKTSLLLLDKPSELLVEMYIHLVPMSHSAEMLWQHLHSLLKQCMHSPRKTIHLAGEKNGWLHIHIHISTQKFYLDAQNHIILICFTWFSAIIYCIRINNKLYAEYRKTLINMDKRVLTIETT